MRAAGYYRRLGSDARSEQADISAIDRYCREGFHTLSRIIGPGEPTSREADQYRALVSYLDGLGRGEALVVIPGPLHLSDTLDGLVERLVELDRVGGEVRCTDPDLPDPLQNGLESLPFAARPPVQNRRVRESLMSKAARGEVLGRTPYGYVAGIDGTFKIESSEGAVVRRLFGLYVGESYSNEEGKPAEDSGIQLPATGPGLRRIAGIFNREGLRTRSGRPWTPVTLSGMLRNRVYVGSYVRYGMRIAGNHDRIVDRDAFNRAQVIMASRSPVRKTRVLSPYMLSGLARCWSCGQGMHGLERKSRWTRVDGSTEIRSYRYYACPSRSTGVIEEEGGEGKPHPVWRESDLDRATLDALRAEPIESLRASYSPIRSDTTNDHLRAAEHQFMESVRAVASGRGNVSDLATPLDELQTTRNMTESNLADQGGDITFEGALGAFDKTDTEELHGMIASFVDRVIVHVDRIEPVYRAGTSE